MAIRGGRRHANGKKYSAAAAVSKEVLVCRSFSGGCTTSTISGVQFETNQGRQLGFLVILQGPQQGRALALPQHAEHVLHFRAHLRIGVES